MAYNRFTITPCGETFVYRSNWSDPSEFVKTMKYVCKPQYRDCKYVENKWWKLVDFMSRNNGCTYARLRNFLSTIRYWDATHVMRKLLVRVGTPGNYKYYMNLECKAIYEKGKNAVMDPAKLEKAKQKYIKAYDAAVEESKQYPILLHNYVAEHAIDALP